MRNVLTFCALLLASCGSEPTPVPAPIAAAQTHEVAVPVDGGYVAPRTPPSPVTTAGTWRVEGRYISTDASGGPGLSWAGSKLTFRFQGTSVTITFKDTTQYDNSNAYFNYYDVFVDGSQQPKIPIVGYSLSTRTMTITAPTSGVHEVTLVKRTEESAGVTTFTAWDKTLLQLPADTRTRKMEFIGDSLTMGYKIEGAFTAFGTESTNAARAYSMLTAAHFNAEAHVIACAGRGLAQDATGGAYGGTMVDRWLRVQDGGVHPYTDGVSPNYLTAPWNFAAWQADVVTVNLGTNDLIAAGASYASAGLRAAFLSFFQQIRTKYPTAWIVGILPSQPQGAPRTYLQGEIQGALTDLADARTSFLAFPVPNYGVEGQAGDGHPTMVTHQIQAGLLIAHLQGLLGWQ